MESFERELLHPTYAFKIREVETKDNYLREAS